VLRSAGAEKAKVVVAATGDDDVNLLVAQLSNSKFAPETILARVNNPSNVDAFEELGVRTTSPTLATAQALDNYIERPAMMNWMGEIGQSGDVQEVELTADELIGRTIEEISDELPSGVLVALVARDGDTRVPTDDFTVEYGDRVTIIGEREVVREAMSFVNPDD
jgi:Trk K+ transport system NAD-binding subunit